MTSRSHLFLNVYAPPLVGNDGRPYAAVQGLERAVPGLHLEWKVSEEGRLTAVPNREAWLSEAAGRGKFPLLCNGDEGYPVTISGLRRPAGSSPGGRSQLQVHAELPLDAAVVAVAMDVLEHVAEGVRAQWGVLAPSDVMQVISDQAGPKLHGPEKPPLGLPAVRLPEEIPAPEIPRHLGWLNYWSEAAAQVIGFPNPSRDAEILARSRRTATGGWIIRLTDAPLDLDDPAHLDMLLKTYERLPAIGGRSVP